MLYALQRYLKYFAFLGLVPWAEKGPQQLLQKIYTMAIIVFNVGIAFNTIVYSPPEGDLLVSMLVSCIVFISQIVTMTGECNIIIAILFDNKTIEIKQLSRYRRCASTIDTTSFACS